MSQANSPFGQGLKGEILRNSLRLFARHGYDAVSTTDIANAVGCSQASVMYHFSTKENLWKASVTALFEEIRRFNFLGLERFSGLSGAAQLRIATERLIEASSTYPQLGQIISREGIEGGERITWLYTSLAKNAYLIFEEILERGIEDGSLKLVHPRIATIMIHGAAATLFNLPALTELLAIDKLDATELVQTQKNAVLEMLLNGLST